MGNIGLAIALRTKDARSGGAEDMVVDSRFSHMKTIIVRSDTYTFGSNPGAGVTTLLTITHNLGYKATFEIFHDYDSGSQISRMPWTNFSAGVNLQYIEGFMQDNSLIIKLVKFIDFPPDDTINLNGKTFIFKTHIFVDPGA